jgi:hypothetical protein
LKWAVLKKWTPCQGSPRNLGLAVAQLVKSAAICHWLQSRKGNATVTSDASQRHAQPARRAPLPPQIKSCLPFSNSNPQLTPTDIIMSAIARNRMKNWEVIADNLSKAGCSYGYVSAIDSNGRTIWIADAHQGDEKRCLKKERERNTHPPALPLVEGLSSPRRQPDLKTLAASLGKQGRLDYVNFGTYVPRI